MKNSQLKDEFTSAGISGVWTCPTTQDVLPRSKGSYVLAIHLGKPMDISIGRACCGRLQAGWYFYLGSARGSGGLAARLKRHFREDKKPHWHVDRLTMQAVEMNALAVPGGRECDLVDQMLASELFKVALEGFGNSDCGRCSSHLLMPAKK